MKSFILSAGVIVVGSAVWVATGSSSTDKPSRADCISGAELDWPERSIDKGKILNEIAEVDPVVKDYPTSGLSIHDQKVIYIIFKENCGQRQEMMASIMAEYKKKISNFPSYNIIERQIEPSSSTIQVYGKYWSDGEEPEGVFK